MQSYSFYCEFLSVIVIFSVYARFFGRLGSSPSIIDWGGDQTIRIPNNCTVLKTYYNLIQNGSKQLKLKILFKFWIPN